MCVEVVSELRGCIIRIMMYENSLGIGFTLFTEPRVIMTFSVCAAQNLHLKLLPVDIQGDISRWI